MTQEDETPRTGAGPTQSDAARSGARALAITIGVLGAGALALSGVGVAFAAVGSSVASSLTGEATTSVGAAGATAVEADVAAGELRVEFGPVSEAVLEAEDGGASWTLDRDGDAIVVGSEDRFGWPVTWGRGTSATLTLPASLAGVDLDAQVDAGRLVAEGDFGDVTAAMSAGSTEIEGTARSVDAEMSAGRGVLALADVGTADLEVTAGRLDAAFAGEAPGAVAVRATAGSVSLTLPDVPYDVRTSRDAGEITSRIAHDPAADRTLDIAITAGSVEVFAE
ncbi:hypothetical protein [Microbacterium sp. ZXX196]|uniref:hypothetical protein n=1 Tax=Microbacterium sp. ZXX196 TaxID=2609291 RepID=UPI0012BA0247|nr:hypothetical protein [Microbacterium sp. ZXX196]MTE23491.1 hypothetical protein [Microbacterium sp. ZXX196]